jgi:hypothetical protein
MEVVIFSCVICEREEGKKIMGGTIHRVKKENHEEISARGKPIVGG